MPARKGVGSRKGTTTRHPDRAPYPAQRLTEDRSARVGPPPGKDTAVRPCEPLGVALTNTEAAQR